MILRYNTSEQAQVIYDRFVSILKTNAPVTGDQFIGNYDVGDSSAIFYSPPPAFEGGISKRIMLYKDNFVIGMLWHAKGDYALEDSTILHYAEIQVAKIR